MGGTFDAEGDAMTVRLVTGPDHGQLTLEADGTFTYVADEGFTGLDRFEFVVTDGMGDSVVKRVRLRVPEFVVIRKPRNEDRKSNKMVQKTRFL